MFYLLLSFEQHFKSSLFFSRCMALDFKLVVYNKLKIDGKIEEHLQALLVRQHNRLVIPRSLAFTFIFFFKIHYVVDIPAHHLLGSVSSLDILNT